jgi:hypothetical protein
MPFPLPGFGHLDLIEAFCSVQKQMLAQMAVSRHIGHSVASGTAAEQIWLDVLGRYLPKRYSAAPGFVIDSEGRRSRQIDIVIFDNLHSPLLLPHESGLHIPAESVHAVFEVKVTLCRPLIRDAQKKAASVRALRREPVRILSGNKLLKPAPLFPILAGILATRSVWAPTKIQPNLRKILKSGARLDLGCSLEQGSFEKTTKLTFSIPKESLIFFILRLIERLRDQGTAPTPDMMKYGRHLDSFKSPKK